MGSSPPPDRGSSRRTCRRAPRSCSCPATILRLLGLSAEGLDGEPLAAILAEDAGVAAGAIAPETPPEASDEPVYSEEEERQMVERLRDLGYE